MLQSRLLGGGEAGEEGDAWPKGHPDKLARSGPEKRLLTNGERAKMAAGDIAEISPNVISNLLKGGWSFGITDKRCEGFDSSQVDAGPLVSVDNVRGYHGLCNVFPTSEEIRLPPSLFCCCVGWLGLFPSPRYMDILPPAARMRYPFDFYLKGGACHALLDQTMIPGQSVAAMTREVAQV